MLFAVICKDKPGHLALRKETRADHVAYLEALNANGALKFAGPFLDAGGNPCGSLVVVEANDRTEAEAVAGADPYARAGLFQSVEILAWNWFFNRPEAS